LNASGLQTEFNHARELGGKTFIFHRAYSLFKSKINAPRMLSFIESCTQINPSLRPSSREALISLATVLTDTDFSNLEMAMGEVDINADMKNADTNDDTSDEDMTLPPPKYLLLWNRIAFRRPRYYSGTVDKERTCCSPQNFP
jgi:hypothetical protein